MRASRRPWGAPRTGAEISAMVREHRSVCRRIQTFRRITSIDLAWRLGMLEAVERRIRRQLVSEVGIQEAAERLCGGAP